ncbi:hypothetical protein SEPL_030 [Salmonella phage SE_PL]|nr:hypothetical protein 7t3_0584 [Salmonella phage 7t3]QIG62643.1 hypothetical protein SEPL_030 [Salmonella phage SE_PL]WNV47505.1 hypothetical protein [Klebsiella phage fENko-Kae01]
MSKVKIKGTVTEVKPVEIDIYIGELVKSAIPHMTIEDVEKVLRILVEQKFRENDPTIPKDAEMNLYFKLWEKYSFTDYHKNEDVYSTVRKFNEEELQYLIAIEAVMSVFK